MTREDAIKTLRELWRETEDRWYEETYSLAIKALEQMPSADAVEVVRCKDCLIHGLCRFEQGLGLDGFCSKGERKDG